VINRLMTTVAILAALALAACGEDDEAPEAQAPAEASASQEAGGGDATAAEKPSNEDRDVGAEKPGITIATRDSQFGPILFDASDRAIYFFDKETSEKSECYGACADAWPPVLTKGDPKASGAAEAKLLGTTERDDGSTQVTYAGRPLYYYVDDPIGEALCHNVDEFGGLWLVVEPGGEAVG
jgi:predicted lipoprotein with Yx(FWY)xxD motif